MTFNFANIPLAQAHAREGIDLILPETSELIWGAICFVIVFVVLNRVALPQIKAAIEKREQSIQSDKENAEKARAEGEKMLEEHKQQLAETRSEANRIIEDARQQAEQVRKDIIAKSEKDAEAIVERAQEQIQAERNRTVQELRSTIAEISIDLAERVVGRSIDAGAQREMVDAYIKEVAAMSGNGDRTR